MGKFLIANLASSTFFFRKFTSIAFAFFPTISLAEQTGLTSHKCRITGLLSFSLRLGIPGHLRTLLIEIDNAKNAMSQNGYLTTERNSKWPRFLFYPVIRIIQVSFSKFQLQIRLIGSYLRSSNGSSSIQSSTVSTIAAVSLTSSSLAITKGSSKGYAEPLGDGRGWSRGHSRGFHGLMA